MRHWCLRTMAVLTAILLPGCASLMVADTTALSPSQLAPPDSETISNDGYRLDAVTRQGELADLLVLVAMSGGGKRSAAFAYGVLKGMRDVPIPFAGGDRP